MKGNLTMFSIGDKVTVLVSKSEDWEMRELAARFGDEVDGTVIGQTGRILMVETLNGLRLNPFIQDVEKGN
jgi:ribosomal protein L21E